ncbi:hypothetical protein [Pyrococcus kukulkanii]|nr:hypothetical protein [Pyrococcus kukulkanii]
MGDIKLEIIKEIPGKVAEGGGAIKNTRKKRTQGRRCKRIRES